VLTNAPHDLLWVYDNASKGKQPQVRNGRINCRQAKHCASYIVRSCCLRYRFSPLCCKHMVSARGRLTGGREFPDRPLVGIRAADQMPRVASHGGSLQVLSGDPPAVAAARLR
jgi:hypothetical protein